MHFWNRFISVFLPLYDCRYPSQFSKNDSMRHHKTFQSWLRTMCKCAKSATSQNETMRLQSTSLRNAGNYIYRLHITTWTHTTCTYGIDRALFGPMNYSPSAVDFGQRNSAVRWKYLHPDLFSDVCWGSLLLLFFIQPAAQPSSA